MTRKLTPHTLSDRDIVSDKAGGASLCSTGLRAAALTAALIGAMETPASAGGIVPQVTIVNPVGRLGTMSNPGVATRVPQLGTPVTKTPGGGFPIGVIYKPGSLVKTR